MADEELAARSHSGPLRRARLEKYKGRHNRLQGRRGLCPGTSEEDEVETHNSGRKDEHTRARGAHEAYERLRDAGLGAYAYRDCYVSPRDRAIRPYRPLEAFREVQRFNSDSKRTGLRPVLQPALPPELQVHE